MDVLKEQEKAFYCSCFERLAYERLNNIEECLENTRLDFLRYHTLNADGNYEYKFWDLIGNEEYYGFIITSAAQGILCLPGTDYSIADIYIKPLYRRKHYAEAFLRKIINSRPGTYIAKIDKQNEIAKMFFRHIAEEYGTDGLRELNLSYEFRDYDLYSFKTEGRD